MSEAALVSDHSEAAQIPEHVAADRVHDFDMYRDARLLKEGHLAYAALQKDVPQIFYTPRNGGHWVVTGYDLMSAIVRDPEHFSSAQLQIPPVEGVPPLIPINLDPPHNTPYRQILTPWFAPKSIRKLQGHMEQFATELVDRVAKTGQCDFLTDISGRYPVAIFMGIMGLPLNRYDEFRDIVLRYYQVQGQPEVYEITAKVMAALDVIVEERRHERRDDLISYLLDADLKGRPLTADEIRSINFLLFAAGLDTVANALTFGMHFIAGSPEIQARLRAEPEKIEAAVDEVLRLFGVANIPRIVAKDCELFGVSFKKGEMLLNALPVAGRDPTKNDNAGVFDLDRDKRNHLTFSMGTHTCLGNFLAKFEMVALFKEWFGRIPEFRVADEFVPSFRGGTVMSLDSLDLVWDGDKAI